MTIVAALPETAKSRGRVAPAKLAHLVLRTQPERMSILTDWYKTVLEAEAMAETDRLAFLTYDQEHHRIAIIAMPGLKDHADGHVGLHHVAFTYDGLGDLVHTY